MPAEAYNGIKITLEGTSPAHLGSMLPCVIRETKLFIKFQFSNHSLSYLDEFDKFQSPGKTVESD